MNNKRNKKKRLGYSRVRLTIEEMEAFQSFDGLRSLKAAPLGEPENKDEYPEIGMDEVQGEELIVCPVAFFKAKSGAKGNRTHVALGSEDDIALLKEILSDYREGRREVRKRNKKKANEEDVSGDRQGGDRQAGGRQAIGTKKRKGVNLS